MQNKRDDNLENCFEYDLKNEGLKNKTKEIQSIWWQSPDNNIFFSKMPGFTIKTSHIT